MSERHLRDVASNKKPSRWDREGSQMVRRLCADDVGRLKALGALEQVKLHGLALVKSAIAVLLDRRKMHEHIFPCRALDKSISLRSIEPLHCSFLSHGTTPFTNREIILHCFPECTSR